MSFKAALAGGLAALTSFASAALADPVVWTVKGPHASIAIVGSTVAVPADGRWRTAALHDAAAKAEEIWFITPFGLPSPFAAIHILALIQTKGSLPEGQSLSAKLSPQGRADLAKLSARDGVPMAKLERMTPWNAQITLTLADRKRDGTVHGLPVERYVVETAPHAAKRGFDRLDDDLKILMALPEQEQVYNLEESMHRLADPGENPRYGKAWADGDLGWIERERDQRLRQAAPVTYRTMQLEPRARWVEQIARLAEGSKNAIVVVDAANLVGQNGLPAMLRRRGLQVEGP